MARKWKALSSIVSRIEKRLTGGVATDEEVISHQVIEDEVHKVRVEFLMAAFAKQLRIPIQYYQRICCLEVKCIADDCGEDVSGDKRHVLTVPGLIEGLGRNAIRFVGPKKGTWQFKYSESHKNYDAFFPFQNQETVKDQPYFFIENGKDIVMYNPLTENFTHACVEIITANPDDESFASCGLTDETDYPMPSEFVRMLEDEVVKILSVTYAKQPDLQNDAAPKTK